MRRPFAHQDRQARLHDGDAEAGRKRRGIERPHVDRAGTRRAGERRDHHAGDDRADWPDPRDHQRSRDRGEREQQQRQSDEKPDLGLRHVQFAVHQRDHRRHREDGHAHGDAAEPQRAHRFDDAAGRDFGGVSGKEHEGGLRVGGGRCISAAIAASKTPAMQGGQICAGLMWRLRQQPWHGVGNRLGK